MPWQQGHPAAPWAALATAPPADRGKGLSLFRPHLECCLQLGLPVEKRFGQTKASPEEPPGWSGWEQRPYEKVPGELGLLWGPSSHLPLPTGRLLRPRTPAFLRRMRDSGQETQEVQAGPSGQEVKQVVQGGCAVSILGGLSRKSAEQPGLISYLTIL